jgi:ribosome maturation factor RimP
MKEPHYWGFFIVYKIVKTVQQELDKLIRSTVNGLGYELWGYEYRPQTESALLRIFIESEQGISVEDCSTVSRQIGAALDVDDLIPIAYILEVSSPGIDRVLFDAEQYQHYLDENIKIRTRISINGRRNFKGKMVAVNENDVTVEIDNLDYDIPFDTVDRARVLMDVRPKKR